MQRVPSGWLSLASLGCICRCRPRRRLRLEGCGRLVGNLGQGSSPTIGWWSAQRILEQICRGGKYQHCPTMGSQREAGRRQAGYVPVDCCSSSMRQAARDGRWAVGSEGVHAGTVGLPLGGGGGTLLARSMYRDGAHERHGTSMVGRRSQASTDPTNHDSSSSPPSHIQAISPGPSCFRARKAGDCRPSIGRGSGCPAKPAVDLPAGLPSLAIRDRS